MHSARSKNCQLRHHLRHHDLRSCPTHEHRKPRGKADHRRLLPHLPGVQAYMEKAKEMAREKGYAETLFHRRRYLPDINSKNGTVRGFAERNAINAPIQGSEADIIKVAMIRIFNRFRAEGIRSKMIIQVHDELNFSVYPEEKEKVEKIVVEEMQNATTSVCLWLLMPDGETTG